MSANPNRVTVGGSERAPVPGAHVIGDVPPDERFEVTLRLRPKKPLGSDQMTSSNTSEDTLPQDRNYMTRDELAASHGADPQDIAKVTDFANKNGLVVVDASEERRSVVLSGTSANFSAAFGVQLKEYDSDYGTFRGRLGAVTIPADLEGIIEGVFGLDDRPQAKSHYQNKAAPPPPLQPMTNSAGTFTPPQIASLYHFPSGLDGSGQCIALIELGGGYRTTDIKAYFKNLGLPVPKVKTIRVDGGKNRPTNANSADGEVMLDIEVAAAVAPKALIVVYFAPNTDQGFLDAITTALHDNVNKPSVISISWGSAESSWTNQAMQQFNQAFQAAAALGVTVCAAAGDNGSTDGVTDGSQHVDFPASSPYVLGCGGTRLVGANNTITSETVWNDGPNSATGGGMSTVFPLPSYQKNIPLPASNNPCRGVPDVAGDADPVTGYQVRVDGANYVFGGTSAVAPLWAGLIALMNQKLNKPVGFLNPLIYGSLAGKGVVNDVTSGNNGAFSAATGWDACTGWGSPVGDQLLAGLGG